ncbi:MAG: Ldh family oxidoreductase [bacterium]|jgi:L-2-hydroxycarboxylate dehydrogenase (NAD+)
MNFSSRYEVTVAAKCTACGMCTEYCALGILSIDGERAKANEAIQCNGCCACVDVCPVQAITVRELGDKAADEPFYMGDEIRVFISRLLEASNVPGEEAQIVAASLLEAELRGITSHGLARLAGYLKRIASGLMLPATAFKVIKNNGVISVCDAANGWGQVAGQRAMELCLAKAKDFGVGIATVCRSNHFGTASFFTLQASRAGFIGLAAGNAGPSMAAWGGRKPVLGSNPISMALPSPWGDFCVDMALTSVAKSKIRLAVMEERPIPSNWAIDAKGIPTLNPLAALEGTLQPVGGAKGYAAALLIDFLSGVLSGAAYASDVRGTFDYRGASNIGQFFMAINPEFFMEPEEFRKRVADWAAKIKAGDNEVRLPGERKAKIRAENEIRGLRLSTKTKEGLEILAKELDVPIPWE